MPADRDARPVELDEAILANDRYHEPVDDGRWRESYYFSFFDVRHRIGGFTSIGKRPAKGHSGSINVLWGPEIATLVASEFDSFDRHDDTYRVQGLRYQAERPFGRYRLAFSGDLNDGGTGVECDRAALGPTTRSSAPKIGVSYELTFTPTYPPYAYAPREEWHNLFTGHVDELGTIEGELVVDGRSYDIVARAAKDHSWGVRDWFKPAAWRWIDLVSEDADAELALWRTTFDGSNWLQDGALYASGVASSLGQYSEDVETEARDGKKRRPRAIRFSALAGDARIDATGRVARVVPVFFSRSVGEAELVSWNDRALVECTLGNGETGWANVEFAETLRPGV